MNKLVTLIFTCSFVLLPTFAIDLYLPSLPTITAALHATTNTIQLSMTLYLTGYSLGLLIAGPLADHFGRRKILLIGLFIFSVASVACALSISAGLLVISRFIQGIGAGAPGVLWRTLLRDRFEGTQLARATTTATTAWAFSPIIAPVLGSYIQHHLGWRSNFLVLTITGVILWVISYFFFVEKKNVQSEKLNVLIIMKKYFRLSIHRIFIGNIIVCAMLFGVTVAFGVAAPFLFQSDLGLTIVQYGWLILLISLGYIIGANINNLLLVHFERRKILIFGLILLLGTSMVMAILALMNLFNVYVIAIPIFIIFISFNFVYPIGAASAMEPFANQAGIASALSTIIIVVGASLASACIAVLSEHTQLPLALSILVMGVVALLCYIFIVPRTSKQAII